MGAPLGNNYWQFRNKHGRDYKYQPEELWEEFKQYVEWVNDTPWYKNEAIKSGDMAGTIIPIPTRKPLTIEGFCLFADIVHKTFMDYEKRKDFVTVVTRIRGAIENDQLEGASVGAYNPNIIARKLGLQDKQQTEHTGEIIVKPPKFEE